MKRPTRYTAPMPAAQAAGQKRAATNSAGSTVMVASPNA